MSTRKKVTTVKKAAPRRAPAPAPARRAYAPRPYYYYKGTGDYVKAPRAIRPSKATTKSLGGTIGAHLGHGLQTVIKALTGFGDYEVESNSLMPKTLGGDPPIVRNTTSNAHIVHHREYIGDVYASTAFSVTSYPINPGLLGTFPWVSQQADSYEQYKFRGLVFEFKSMSSDSVLATAASSSLGTVVMSTQYNVLDTPFTDKRTMENYEFANSCKPSCSMLHPIECKMSQTTVSELYTRVGNITQGDLRLYDLGTFSIAVQGMQNAGNNQVIGELWCSYELEFYKPKLLIGGGALLTDHFRGGGVGVYSTAAIFGTGVTLIRTGSNIGCILQQTAIAPYGPNSIVFPAFVQDGTYQITYSFTGSIASAASPGYAAGGTTVNIDVVSSAVTIFSGSSSFLLSPQSGANTTTFTLTQIVKILQTSPGLPPGIQILFPSGAFPTGSQTCDIVVTQIVAGIQ